MKSISAVKSNSCFPRCQSYARTCIICLCILQYLGAGLLNIHVYRRLHTRRDPTARSSSWQIVSWTGWHAKDQWFRNFLQGVPAMNIWVQDPKACGPSVPPVLYVRNVVIQKSPLSSNTPNLKSWINLTVVCVLAFIRMDWFVHDKSNLK